MTRCRHYACQAMRAYQLADSNQLREAIEIWTGNAAVRCLEAENPPAPRASETSQAPDPGVTDMTETPAGGVPGAPQAPETPAQPAAPAGTPGTVANPNSQPGATPPVEPAADPNTSAALPEIERRETWRHVSPGQVRRCSATGDVLVESIMPDGTVQGTIISGTAVPGQPA